MSYSRFSGADVYTFFSVSGKLECCGCILQEREWVDDPTWPIFKGHLQAVDPIIETEFDSTAAMVAHLREHIAAGHHVPDYVIPAIEADDAENFGGDR